MHSLASTATLALHLVPAGRRLDFPVSPGQFAYVYRRGRGQQWECVARNACSPYLDRTPVSPDATFEYVVQYHDASGLVTGRTPIVQVVPAMLPVSPNWVSLR